MNTMGKRKPKKNSAARTSNQLPLDHSRTPGMSTAPQSDTSVSQPSTFLQGAQNVGSSHPFGLMCVGLHASTTPVQLPGHETVEKIHDDIMKLIQRIKNVSAEGQVQYCELEGSLTKLYSKMRQDSTNIENSSQTDGCDVNKLCLEMKEYISEYIMCIQSIRGQTEKAKVAFTNIDSISEALSRYLNDLVSIYRNLEHKIECLTTASQQNQEQMSKLEDSLERHKGRVGELEKEVCEYKSTVDEYRSKFEHSETKNEELQSKVQDLTITVEDQKNDIKELKEQNKLSETEKAKLVLRSLLTQVPTLMYKVIFPRGQGNKKTFHYKDLDDKLKRMKRAVDKESDPYKQKNLQKEYDDKVGKLRELERKIGWDEDIDDAIKNLKENCACNVGAHPVLKDRPHIEANIKLLEDSSEIDDDDVQLCDKVTTMWELLSPPTSSLVP